MPIVRIYQTDMISRYRLLCRLVSLGSSGVKKKKAHTWCFVRSVRLDGLIGSNLYLKSFTIVHKISIVNKINQENNSKNKIIK